MVTLHAEPSQRSDEPPTTPRRELVLRATVARTASNWTNRWFRTLADDGRRVEGGWPGTLPEARARIAADAERALGDLSMPALTQDELGRLTRMTYEEARRLWLAGVGPTG